MFRVRAGVPLLAALSVFHPAAPPPNTPLPATPWYALTVRIAPDSAYLAVDGSVTIPAADSARSSVTLTLLSAFTNARFAVPGSGGDSVAVRRDSLGIHTRWTLTPLTPFPAGVPVTVRFTYSGRTRTAYVFHIGNDGSFAGGNGAAWYPFVRGLPNTRGTGRVDFTVPAGFTVVASGRRVSSSSQERTGEYRFSVDVPMALSFAAGRYVVLHRAARVPIALYLLHERANARQYLDGVADIFPILEREFGPYPFPAFAIVETPLEASQAASFGGASLPSFMLAAGPNLDKPFNRAFYGHEMSHQWWPNLVSASDNSNMMLSEGMAQYGSLRVVEAMEGAASAERYRRTGYPDYSGVGSASGYFTLAAAGLDRYPLRDLPGTSVDHDLADTKGFLVWDMLSREMGRPAFCAALNAFARDHAFETVPWNTFLAEVARASHRDLGAFFDQWFNRTGAPEWRVSWRQAGDSVRGRVTQIGAPYRVSVEVRITGRTPHDSTTRHVVLGDSTTDFAWRLPFVARALTLDKHFLILHWEPSLAREARAIAPYTRALYLSTTSRDSAYNVYQTALDSVVPPDSFGLKSLLEYGRAWLYFGDGRWSDAQASMQASLRDAHEPSPPACRGPGGNCTIPWGHYLIARTAATLGDTALACQAAKDAGAADSHGSYGVAGSIRALALTCRRGGSPHR